MTKLLLVDDEEIVRVCLTAILVAFGYSVIGAKDGLEAYALYQKKSDEISLVVMDIQMPKLNGIEATNMMKKFDSNTKVILMSGQSDDLWREKADAFIQKSFGAKDLLAVVRKVLEGENPAILGVYA